MDVELDAESGQGQQALLAQLAQAKERLDHLVADLREVDRELEDLSTERRQHELLGAACGVLEELSQLGGAALFWGDRSAATGGEEQLQRARGRVAGFQKRLGEIEERRQVVFEEVMRQQDDTDWIQGDVYEAEEEARQRAEEWTVEREISALPLRDVIMPWARGGEDDERFRKSVGTALAISLLLAIVIPQIELPVFEPDPELALPDRVVRLMAEKRPLPPPPPREETPLVPDTKKIAEESVPAASKPKVGPSKGAGEGPAEGPGKGLLAFKEQLAGIKVNQQLARLGADARLSNAGAASGPVERSMIATLGAGSSGGINLAELSRGVNAGGSGGGAGAMEAVQIARATSTLPGGGGGRGVGAKGVGNGAIAGRTDEEIQIVFDRHKAELYRLYNRELRRDPTLRGQMILRLKIEPDGSVSFCELKGTDMNAPQLAAQVVERVHGFDFGAKDVGAVTILYPIDFLPAG
jgi:hypothetical protein